MDEMYERIEQLCREAGVNVTTMCREAGVPRSALSDYKAPREGRRFSDCKPLSYVLGKEEKPAAPKDGELVKDELIGFYGDVKEHLTEGDIEDIKTLMKLRAELNRSKE